MENFINEIRTEMKRRDVKNIGFKLAPFIQDIYNEKYEEFVEDIKNYDYEILVHEDEISVFTKATLEFFYKIKFSNVDVWNNYCQCKPTDEGYNDEYECCGENCDYLNSEFYLQKVYLMGYSTFEGKAKDLWKAIDEVEVLEEKKKIEKEKKQLQHKIDELQKKLDMLNN